MGQMERTKTINLARGGVSHKAPRRRKPYAAIAVALALVVAVATTFVVSSIGAQTALLNAEKVVDPDTTNTWNNFTAPGGTVSTQNIGRVWTDKSVFDDTYTFSGELAGQTIETGDSDFLVSLSALSSTSNLKETIRTTTPLDIVLVLDQSGSMADQFSGGVSRRTALRNAANSFIDSAEALNNGVEQENQIRMSIVTFDTGARVSRDWTYVSGNGTDQLHRTINSLDQEGATRVDLGLDEANDQLGSARTDAKKVVIVFTDGDPTSGSSFENEVAADAINNANSIKQQRGATVYTIGIFSGANPNTDNNANNYMNAVSSNFPDATAVGRNPSFFDWSGEFSITWGDGSRNNGYYKNASNSDQLNQVFEDIFDESTEDFGSGSPIVDESEEGNTDPGTLTFTDQLGSYMEVTGTGAGPDKIQVVYGDQIFSSTSKTTEGNVDTYTFTGTVSGNAVYGEADLSKLVVTVTCSTDVATGDLVSVTIPANLLPMRNYDVDTESGTMTVTDAYPIRLFYGVSLKEEARQALTDPQNPDNQELYGQILAASGEGETFDFYTNSFVQNQAEGKTTATFEPNAGNKFYYYTTDTDLYIDAACTQRATRWNIDRYSTLYYRDNYWVAQGAGTDVEGGTSYQATNTTQNGTPNYGTISRSDIDWSSIQYRNNNAYIPGGTQRQDRPASLNDPKSENVTETAENVLSPAWNEDETVTQHLGNNGKLSVEKPGSIEIKKTVDWGNASDETKQSQGAFTFTVSLKDAEGEALAGKFPYAVYSAGEEALDEGMVGDGDTVTIDTRGDSSQNRVVISMLPKGATFTIEEQGANDNGFTTTDHTAQQGVQNDANDGSVTGTVEAGSQVSVDFTNAYSADEPVMLSTSTTLMVQKVLDGRDWRDTDSFEFNLSGQNNAPMPTGDGATVVVTNGDAASFGDIEFTAAGTYTYIVTENDEVANPILGIDYSNALYTVTVVVDDGGQGNLKIDSVTIEQTTDDQSGAGSGAIEGSTMTFTNTYSSDTGSTGIDGFKDYTDGSGTGNPLVNGKFSFQIEALGGYKTGTVEGEATADDYTVSAAETPMPEGTADGAATKVVTNEGDQFHFGNISFDATHVGMTFEYRVTELARGADGQSEANMSYDENSYVLKIEVTEEDGEDDEGNPEAHIVATPSIAAANLRFENTFTPEEVTLGEDGAATINGTKALDGRDMTAEDEFNFTLAPYGTATTDAIAADEIAGITDAGLTAKVNGPADENEEVPFSFSGITFTKAGTYQFVLDETETGTNDAGITYDEHTCIVTVEVGVDHATGKLTADVSYDANGYAFVNTYKANMNYGAEGAGGIELTKTMNDRPINNGDFAFNLNGEGPDGQIGWEQNVPAAAMGSDGSAAESTLSALQNLTFDQDDAGKTFTFTVTETVPAEGDRLAGVVYDQSEYEVAITVVDNGDGTMHTLTTVTQTKDVEGQEIADGGTVVVDAANSDADDYTTPSFGFTNSYEPEPVTTSDDTETTLQVTKTVEGAPSPAGVTYEFTLTPADTNPAEVTGTAGAFTAATTDAIDEGGSETVSFGALTFTKPGIYTFTVQETAPDTAKGWEYDTDPKTITVTVDDQNPETQEYDGKLYITEVTGNPAEVTNSYEAEPVIVGGEDATNQITVQKTVTGADSTADFTFVLEPVDPDDPKWNSVKPVDEGNFSNEETISGVAQGTPKTATFDGIAFSAEGTYEFQVTEKGAADFNAGSERNGWTYDEHVAHVTVTVTDDDHDGQLDAEVTYDNADATNAADQGEQSAAAFTNAYEAAQITVDATEFAGEKTVSGRPWLDGEAFGFTMEKGDATEGGDWAAVTTEDGSAFESATATAEQDGTNATVSFDFGEKITFSQAGVYTFNVTETQHNGEALPASNPTDGMTYDRHTGVITVTVTDNGTGNLEASVSTGTDEASDLSFENTYEATPVTWGFEADELLGGHKYIDDTTGNTYTLAESQFSFTMRAQDASYPMPEGWDGTKDNQGRGMMTVTNGTGNATEVSVYDFGWIEFTHDDMTGATAVDGQPGVYTKSFQYNIFESGDMPAGISKDNTAYTVTFTVTEDYNTGEMTVTPSAVKIVNGGDGEGTTGEEVDVTKLDFTNTYNPTSISSYMNIFKTLNGRNWQTDDTFTFNVSMTATEIGGGAWPEDAPLPSVDAQGSNYTISEAEVNEAGNGFDYTVTIKPASATGNTYRFDTGKITYEREGVYTYTVSEATSTVANVTADDTEYTVVVTVTDNGGVLDRKVTSVTPDLTDHGTGDQGFTALDFTNVYTPTASEGVPTNFAVQKTFTGHAWTEDFAFEFVLSPVDGAPMPQADADAGVTIDDEGNAHKTINAPTGDSEDTATFDFGAISYDTAGTYRYTVSEVAGDHGGVMYDTDTTVGITVEVKDVAGQLVATATVSGSFNNTYESHADYDGAQGNGGLDITKQLNNRAMATDQFTFTIEATGDNAAAAAEKLGIAEGTTTTVKSAQGAAGQAISVTNNPFDTMSFDQDDDGVTYTYTIKEEGTSGEGDYAGYTLDSSTYTVTITATDNGDGTMTVTTTVVDSDGAHNVDATENAIVTVPFENTYAADPVTIGADGDATIVAKKTLNNDDIANYTGDNAFTFQVLSEGKVIAKGTNDATGAITFGSIEYTTENLAAAANGGSDEVGTATLDASGDADVYTFTYTVAEVTDGLQDVGVTPNISRAQVTVTVTDNRHGELSVEVGYENGAAGIEFENTYGADATFDLTISGNKKITGEAGLTIPTLEDDAFTFQITGLPAEDGTPAPMPATTTATNKSGGVSFGPITYTMENVFGTEGTDANAEGGIEVLTVGRTKKFTYEITEIEGNVPGVDNDTTTKKVEVTVTDEGNGKITAKVSAVDPGADTGNHFTFNNVYSVDPETSSLTGDGGFNITKVLTSTNTDRTLAADEFEFQLIGADGAVVKTATNDVQGNVSFEGIEFTEPGDVTYTLKETNAGQTINGVTYDDTVYNVTAHVKDPGDGTLEVTWEMPQAQDSAVTFENSYTAASTGITFNAAKVLEGRELTEGEFTFELREGDTVLGTATNDAQGNVSFAQIDYDEPGEHDYEIVEVVGDAEGITYDDTVFAVHVSVTDNKTGALEVAWSYGEAGAPVFKNTYTEPAKPVEPVEDDTLTGTGDATPTMVAAAAVAGVAFMGAGVVLAKKRGE